MFSMKCCRCVFGRETKAEEGFPVEEIAAEPGLSKMFHRQQCRASGYEVGESFR